jgi:thioester reductase-like protein
VHNTIEFCNSSPRKPRITFVSSICAVGEWYRKHPNRPLIPEVVAWDKASAMSNGYSESKFEAEKILSDAHAKLGLRVTIIRPGQIGGPAMSSTIRKAWPEQGWLRSVITTSEKIGYWPAHIQPLDWIPVDVLSEGIANTTRCESNYGGMQVFNMLHPNPAPWSLLFTTLRDEFGLSAKEVTLPEWLDKLEPKKLKIHGFLRTFGSGREYNMPFENRKALTMLPKVAPITKEHLVVWMKGWDLKQNESKAQL